MAQIKTMKKRAKKNPKKIKRKKPPKKTAARKPKSYLETEHGLPLGSFEEIKKVKIRVIGIGGGGGSIISEIVSKVPRASFVAANTDAQALSALGKGVIRFQFGESLTRGLGSGMNAELGQEAAFSEKEKIKKMLEGQDLCIFVVCLGGGAGSGAVPVFAKIAKSLGNLTYGIFTMPFQFEGEKKSEVAREALKKIKGHLNAVSVIPNDRVFQIINKETPLKQALSVVNKNLSDSLRGLIETLYQPGLINIDFADFKAILDGQGRLAYLNTVEVQRKEGSVKELIEKVLTSPFYPYNIRGSKGVLFNIAGEKNLSLAEVSQISKTISGLAHPEAKIIFGIAQNQSNQKHSETIKTTLLAAGCGLKALSSLSEKPSAGPVAQAARKRKTSKKRMSRALPKAEDQAAEKEPEENKEAAVKQGQNKSQKSGPAPKAKSKSGKKNSKRGSQPTEAAQKKSLQENTEQKKVRIRLIQEKAPMLQPEPVARAENAVKFASLPQGNGGGEEQIRKSALQVKKETEEMEKQMMEKESFWDTPAFLRRKFMKER